MAYSIYKKEKIKFIENFVKKNDRPPSEEELFNGFTNRETSDSSIDGYRFRASRIYEEYTKAFIDQQLEKDPDTFFELAVEAKKADLKKTLKTSYKEFAVANKNAWNGAFFLSGILQSIAGAFLFALLIGLVIYFVQKGNEVNVPEKIKQELEHTSPE